MASLVTSVHAWLDERFHLDDIKALAQKKKVPIHHWPRRRRCRYTDIRTGIFWAV